MDKTGECGFYTSFFENEECALKEIVKEMDHAHSEFGMFGLVVKDNKVYSGDKVIFLVNKFTLK